MSEVACPRCDGRLEPQAEQRYPNVPLDEHGAGADAWGAALVCASCGAVSPWAKADTRDDAVQAAEAKARWFVRRKSEVQR